MSPTEIKRFNIRTRGWDDLTTLQPGESVIKEAYRFTCATDNSCTLVERNVGKDIVFGMGIVVHNQRWQETIGLRKRQDITLKLQNETIKVAHK